MQNTNNSLRRLSIAMLLAVSGTLALTGCAGTGASVSGIESVGRQASMSASGADESTFDKDRVGDPMDVMPLIQDGHYSGGITMPRFGQMQVLLDLEQTGDGLVGFMIIHGDAFYAESPVMVRSDAATAWVKSTGPVTGPRVPQGFLRDGFDLRLSSTGFDHVYDAVLDLKTNPPTRIRFQIEKLLDPTR